MGSVIIKGEETNEEESLKRQGEKGTGESVSCEREQGK